MIWLTLHVCRQSGHLVSSNGPEVSGMGTRTRGCVYLCVKLYMCMVAVEWVSLVAVISRETVVMKISFQSKQINLRES